MITRPIGNILTISLLAAIIFMYSAQSVARDDRIRISIKDSMNIEAAKTKLNAGIKFYFGEQKHGKVSKDYGEFSSNKKTNGFNKSDTQACSWAFLSAMLSLQSRALREGGNAVINIKSNYKNQVFSSESEYECGAGTFLVGVALQGRVVKLK